MTFCASISLPINSKGKTKRDDSDDDEIYVPKRKQVTLNPLFANNQKIEEEKKIKEESEVRKVFEKATTVEKKIPKFEKLGQLSAPAFKGDAVCQNAYLATVHEAFANEKALVLAPDHVWSMIAQGVAIHVNVNPEQFRDDFVSHQGKKKIEVRNDALVQGNPENSPWEICFPMFSSALNTLVVGGSADLLPTFTTSGETEQIVHTITFMDTVKAFFTYVVVTRCGITSIALQGTKEDWYLVRQRAFQLLDRVRMDFWKKELEPILNQFCALADGTKNDVDFWSKIYFELGAQGSGDVERADGWITKFFPYQMKNGKFVLSNFGAAPHSTFPSSTNCVPFVWDYYGEIIPMKFYAGAVAIGTCGDAVTPSLSWAVAYE